MNLLQVGHTREMTSIGCLAQDHKADGFGKFFLEHPIIESRMKNVNQTYNIFFKLWTRTVWKLFLPVCNLMGCIIPCFVTFNSRGSKVDYLQVHHFMGILEYNPQNTVTSEFQWDYMVAIFFFCMIMFLCDPPDQSYLNIRFFTD